MSQGSLSHAGMVKAALRSRISRLRVGRSRSEASGTHLLALVDNTIGVPRAFRDGSGVAVVYWVTCWVTKGLRVVRCDALRRFSDFANLHTEISSVVGNDEVPVLPSKDLWTNYKKFDPQFVVSRQRELEEWLQAVARSEFQDSGVFLDFLANHANQPSSVLTLEDNVRLFVQRDDLSLSLVDADGHAVHSTGRTRRPPPQVRTSRKGPSWREQAEEQAAPAARSGVECYAQLGLPVNAPLEDVRRAYKKLALKWHPDKHVGRPTFEEAEARFKQIAEAYAALEEAGQEEKSEQSQPQSRPQHQRNMDPYQMFREFRSGHWDGIA